jgi:hypothetical protein
MTRLWGYPVAQDIKITADGMIIMAYHGMINKKMAHSRKSQTVVFRAW